MREPSPRRRTGCSTCSTGSGSPPPSGASRTAWCSTRRHRGLPVGGRGGRAGRGQPAVGDPVRRGARPRRLPGAAPPAARADRRRPRRSPRRRQRTAAGGTRRDGEPGTAGRRAGRPGQDRRPPAGCSPRAAHCRCSACAPPRRWPPTSPTSPPRCSPTSGSSTTAAACSPTGSNRPPRPGRTRCWPSCCPATPGRPSTRCATPATPASPSSRSPTRRSARPPSTPTWCSPPPSAPQLVFDLHTAPMTLAMVLLQAICDAAPRRHPAPPGGVRGVRRPPSVVPRLRGDAMHQPVRAARGTDPYRAGVAAGGRPADADEQPRPGGGRAPRRPGGLRRHREGGPGLAVVPRAGAHPHRRCATTRRCWCSRAARSGSCGPTSGRPGCCWPTPTWSATGPPGRSSAGWRRSA